MRVCLDVTPLLGPPTGIHQVTAHMIDALARRDDVELGGYVLSGRAAWRRGGGTPADRFAIPVRACRWPAGLCHRAWVRFDRPLLRDVTVGAQVVHGTNFTAPGVPGRLITVHDLGPVTHPQWCSPAVRRMGAALRRATQRGAHLHVTTQGAAAECIQALGADPRRVHVIPLGVAPVGAGDAAAGQELAGGSRFVLALGATEPRKNLAILPGLVAPVDPQVRLVVAGPEGRDEAALVAAVRASGLGDRFVRLGSVGAKARADLLCAATVLAYPSLLEGFGLPPLEAVLAGTPVAATDVGVLGEVLAPEIPLARPGDVGAIAERLAQTLDDSRPDPADAVAAVKKRVRRLTWDNTAAGLVDAYKRISEQGPDGA